MPRATVIHNPTAGDGALSADMLRELVRAHGWDPDYATTDDDLDQALQDPGDLVVAAGGDGTVGRVASRLAGRGVPLAILPLGTANNVAAGLGMVEARGGSDGGADGGAAAVAGLDGLDGLASRWRDGPRRTLDVGFARGPWGVRHFVESFGVGVFAHAMPILAALKKGDGGPADPAGKLDYDRRGLRALIRDFRPRPVGLVLDGEPAPGDYLLVEALNGPMLGPNLSLAPDADPGDGRLDVVLVGPADREALGEWLGRVRGNGRGGDRPWRTRRVRSLRIEWSGDPLHIDGRPWGDESAVFGNTRTVERDDVVALDVGLEPEGVPVVV